MTMMILKYSDLNRIIDQLKILLMPQTQLLTTIKIKLIKKFGQKMTLEIKFKSPQINRILQRLGLFVKKYKPLVTLTSQI